jgi:GGDEF domain-containing protein
MVDIDDLKRVNDEYGHQQGDIVLVEVARTLREQCRETDHVARYGGDEMALFSLRPISRARPSSPSASAGRSRGCGSPFSPLMVRCG